MLPRCVVWFLPIPAILFCRLIEYHVQHRLIRLPHRILELYRALYRLERILQPAVDAQRERRARDFADASECPFVFAFFCLGTEPDGQRVDPCGALKVRAD
jgi:hypothetical protein